MCGGDTCIAGSCRDYVNRAEASLRQVLLVARLEPTGARSGGVPLQHTPVTTVFARGFRRMHVLQSQVGNLSEPLFDRFATSHHTAGCRASG